MYRQLPLSTYPVPARRYLSPLVHATINARPQRSLSAEQRGCGQPCTALAPPFSWKLLGKMEVPVGTDVRKGCVSLICHIDSAGAMAIKSHTDASPLFPTPPCAWFLDDRQETLLTAYEEVFLSQAIFF
jgi:hypothetical protein